jgi:uncharacterized membrane protein
MHTLQLFVVEGGVFSNETEKQERNGIYSMTVYLLALLIGIVAGLRAMLGPAMVSWAAHCGWLDLSGNWLAFLGNVWARGILTLLALIELVTDQLPSTPSRTVPVQFGARIVTGALSGAAIGASGGVVIGGLLAGIVGAIIGTLGGRSFRARLAASFGSDRPAAFIEDAVAIGVALVIGIALR